MADLNKPSTVEEAQESLSFWRHRLAEQPVYKRAARQAAQVMVDRWRQRLAEAERARYGPGLLEQVLEGLGVRWRPNPRRLVAGLGVLAVVIVLGLIALVVGVVVFWPELEPIVRALSGGSRGGDG